ncbi:MAG: lipoyl(octanoyl) transferase LipB [Bryobacterales bacterium]|nr:lipoyl(octanoyl) transferase LipB [Bryobacterales bacterium]
MRKLEILDLGRLDWLRAYNLQQEYVARRKEGKGQDTLLLVEHPHVVTMGRNGKESNLLAPPEVLAKAGISYYETNRGGDVTYHGPGQIVGYPIFDLRGWKKDVVAYVRAVEEVLIRVLATYGLSAERKAGMTGVWVDGAKVAAIGIHISRWVSSHGFALNHKPDLSYFRYIVPCGLSLPVTSMEALGVAAPREEVLARIATAFEEVFAFDTVEYLAAVSKP